MSILTIPRPARADSAPLPAAVGADSKTKDPAWVRPALASLLIATGVLYIWNLAASGWANSFYSAAVQAGSVNWEAFFFGSSDAANAITVDKPPASLWIMALSVRIFGLSPWSILVPQALMGVAAVGVVYATLRRRFPAEIALLGGAILAVTPVATLMFRFNNPDALLVLLMTIAGYAVVRAIDTGRARWLIGTGVLLGFGFLTKQLQAFVVVPGFALTYLICAPHPLLRRLRHTLLAGLAMVLAAGWWIAIVELTPARYRPYIGGSQRNSILELTFGYNGLGRLTGNETGSVTGGGGGGRWGATGWTRLFDDEIGGQITWLIPSALILLSAGLVVARRVRTDAVRAQLLMWGTWLIVTGLTFSFMAGIFHAYYTVALAPAVAGCVAAGAGVLWERRHRIEARAVLAVATAVAGYWSWTLLQRTPNFQSWLGPTVLVASLLSAARLLAGSWAPRWIAGAATAAAIAAGLAGPAAYSLHTVTEGHSGSIVTAGPSVAGAGGRGGPGGGGQGGGGQGGGPRPTGGFGGGQGGAGTRTPGGGQGGAGGLLSGTTPSDELVALLDADAQDYTWVAATVGSNNASGYQLATQDPVMSIGGFNGSDPSPTLEQFQAYVADGRIHYFIAGGGFGGSNGGSNASAQIAAWVEQTFTAVTVGGVTLYDLTASVNAG